MDQTDEYEQGERVRTWLRNNGSSLIGGVALGLAALGGWQWWQGQQVANKVEAAAEYRDFAKAIEAGEAEKAQAFASALEKNHGKSPFPQLAALRQAQLLSEQGKHEEALDALDGASAADHFDPSLRELAQLRAARLLNDMGKHEDALKRLDAVSVSSFPSLAAEVRGDAQMALGKRDDARASYQQALATLDQGAPTRPMVEMKFTDAGGSPSAQPEI
jgi:predicted negative regulator of RcsB-dependent stress response